MNVGTKSLLFGVHHIVLHPILVIFSWHRIYGSWPSWREVVAIAFHDVGYFGAKDMDGPSGSRHPILGSKIAYWCFGSDERYLVLYHSRAMAAHDRVPVSRLCAPDKLAICLYPTWLYLCLA